MNPLKDTLDGIHNAMSRLIKCSDTPTTMVVGVSGGADSMALIHSLHVASRTIPQFIGKLNIIGVTVDHRLRPSSSEEADLVHEYLSSIGIDHRICVWHTPHTSENKARDARYSMLLEICKKENASYLVTGHHLDDNIETVLMRMLRGTGPDGLSGIQELRQIDTISVIRPLLKIRKEQLYHYCRYYTMTWYEDSTNHDGSNTRSILRQEKSLFANLGFTDSVLISIIDKANEQRQYMDKTMFSILDDLCTYSSGCAYIDLNKLSNVDAYMIRRLLSFVLKKIGMLKYNPSSEKIERLALHILSGNDSTKTLSNCLVKIDKKKGFVSIMPEKKVGG